MYNRTLVFAASCLGMLIFGIVLTLLGALLPLLIERFGVDRAAAGSLFLLMSLGILAGSLVFGPVVDRYGFKSMLLACTALILIGVEGIAFAPTFGWLRAAVFLTGFGGGVINGGTNALVADVSAEGRGAGLSLLGAFFGVGAFGVPLILGMLLDRFTYAILVAGIGSLVFVLLLFFAAVRFPVPKQAQGFPLRAGLGLMKDPLLLLLGLLLFLQSGIEITAGGWTATFFNEELALAADDAVLFLSLFWLGLMLSRLLLGVVLKRLAAARVLMACIGIALVGAVLLIAARGLPLAAPGLFLLGFGLAAGFPVILGFVGDLYPDLSGTAFGIVLVMALTGGSLMPYLTGILSEALGLRASFAVLPLSLVVLLLLLIVALHRMNARTGTLLAK